MLTASFEFDTWAVASYHQQILEICVDLPASCVELDRAGVPIPSVFVCACLPVDSECPCHDGFDCVWPTVCAFELPGAEVALRVHFPCIRVVDGVCIDAAACPN